MSYLISKAIYCYTIVIYNGIRSLKNISQPEELDLFGKRLSFQLVNLLCDTSQSENFRWNAYMYPRKLNVRISDTNMEHLVIYALFTSWKTLVLYFLRNYTRISMWFSQFTMARGQFLFSKNYINTYEACK